MGRIAFAVAGFVLMGSLVGSAAPQLFVREPVYDFGVVVEGVEVQHAFLIENTGDEVLAVTRIWTTCGCTTTAESSMVLAPGEVKRIEAILSTSGYGGHTVSRAVYLESNDPQQEKTTLTLSGTVVAEAAYLIDASDLSSSLVLLIDIREPEAYLAGHLVGAVSLYGVDRALWAEILPKDVPIVLYDQDGSSAPAVAEQLLPEGFMDLRVLVGGLDEWVRRYGDRLLMTLPLTVGVAAL